MKKEVLAAIITVAVVVVYTIFFEKQPVFKNTGRGNIALGGDIELKRFNSKGHPKSEGYELVVKYPSTWTAQEAERPHIIQKFMTTDGDGILVGCMLQARKLPVSISEQENAEMVSEMTEADLSIEEQYPGARILKFNRTRYEGIPGVYFQMEVPAERANNWTHALRDVHIVAYKNLMVEMDCAATGSEKVTTMEAVRNKFIQNQRPFDLFANSFIIMDKYKEED